MNDATPPADDEPLPFKFVPHGLIVLPGITWDEWCGMYAAVEDAEKSAQFRIGDALLAGEEFFGEAYAQVVDEKYIHRHTGPMWVCRKIPRSRRRPSLSYSLHRETAGLDDEQQEVWLTRAEAGRWTVKELKEAMAAEKARQPGDNGAPPISPDPEFEAGATEDDGPPLPLWEDPEPLVPLAPPDPRTDLSPQSSLIKHSPRDSAPVETAGYTANDIRLLLVRLRELAPLVAIDAAPHDAVLELSDNIAGAMGQPPGPIDRPMLIDVGMALRHIPRAWCHPMKIDSDGTEENWTVELRNGERWAVGVAPTLAAAICEAALSSLLSDI